MKKIVFALLIFTACNNDNDLKAENDYVIFGHFYGECQGEKCIEIYRLTNEDLKEDSKDKYPDSTKPYDGQFNIQLSETLFNSVKSLKTKIPQQLLDTPSGLIGSPDVTDGGGVYLEIDVDGERKYWLIDKMRNNLPEYLIPLMDEIEQDIALINN